MTSSCCHHTPSPPSGDGHEDHHHTPARRDWIMITSAPVIIAGYLTALVDPAFLHDSPRLAAFIHGIHEFVNATWWGVLLGIFFLAIMSAIPREFVMSVLGHKKGVGGIGRAMLAGVLLDLCNHGILMMGTKLYQRGASIGQVMAFLIASPWNSISLTFILIAMIGLKYTLAFLILSCVIAFISGMIFDALVARGTLPGNPNAFDMPEDFRFWEAARRGLRTTEYSPALFKKMIAEGVRDSAIVVRWLLFGIVIAAVLRVFFAPETFSDYFGPTLIGMAATVTFATILEVCSEGSSPIAADLVTRAGAPGNAFTFLMAGASTDYTEIMILKDATKSWKIALFLPLVTLPQIIALGFFLNMF